MAEGDVTVGYLHSHEVGHNFHRSLMDTITMDGMGPQRLANYLPMNTNAGGLDHGRNLVAAQFVDLDQEWLWWIDTDMGWQPDALYRLLEVADPTERPIVGALCYAWKAVAGDGLNGYQYQTVPTLLDWAEGADGNKAFVNRPTWELDGLTQVGATGSAFLVIHRSVFESIGTELGQRPYDRVPAMDGTFMSEDVSFCARAAAVGATIWVHQGVHTNHLKHIHVGPHPADG